MENLLTAIFTKFETGPPDIYTDLAGKLYLTEAPQNESLPYCVYDLVSNVPDEHFAERFESALAQFAIYTDDGSAVNIMTYGDHLKDLFDNCSLTITGYTHIDFNRESSDRLLRNPETMTWQWSCDYEVLMSA